MTLILILAWALVAAALLILCWIVFDIWRRGRAKEPKRCPSCGAKL